MLSIENNINMHAFLLFEINVYRCINTYIIHSVYLLLLQIRDSETREQKRCSTLSQNVVQMSCVISGYLKYLFKIN